MRFSILFLFFIFVLPLSAQDKYSVIDLDNHRYSEFEMLSDTLNEYKVYFTGENHVYKTFNTQFQLKFLQYLHQNQNVKHFVFEQSPAVGYLIQEIIFQGRGSHKVYLKDMFYDPFYKLVLGLEEYNDSLVNQDRVNIHGIDLERFPYFSIYALNDLADERDRTIEGGVIFEQIQAIATSDYADSPASVFYDENNRGGNFQFGEVNARESLLSLIATAYQYEVSIKTELGDDSTIFYSIIESLELGEQWYNAEKKGDIKSPIIRERFMADEFARIYDPNSDEKYYGQFGRCHIHKDQDAGRCYDYYMNSIANRINEIDSSLQNQVLVIPIFYAKSKQFDGRVINDLQLDEKFGEEGESFIIDMGWKNGDHAIVGFYNQLPYIIVSNADMDSQEDWGVSWNETLEEGHLGYYYGYHFFNKLSALNFELGDAGNGLFDRRLVGHTFAFDYFQFGSGGARYSFTYFPEISNGDRFRLRGYNFTVGGYAPFGNEFFAGGVGLNYGYGKFKLIEESDNTVPNLFQSGGTQNKVVYTNDVFIIDPNLELRLTLPLISLNVRGGYAFDLSGKYWRLDEKLKNYRKTSFSAPYVMVGASLHLKVRG